MFEDTHEVFSKSYESLYGKEMSGSGAMFGDSSEAFNKGYKGLYGENLYDSGASISDKINKIKEESKKIKSKLDSGKIKEKEAQQRISKLADKTTKLVKNDVQSSLKNSVDGLKRYIDRNA